MSRRDNTVWIAPGATQFSCLCERCLDGSHGRGARFLDAVRLASVRGVLAPDADVAFVRCHFGHEVVVRRIDRPAALAHRPDGRQLQLA
jgi:hypothetical protein